MKANATDAVKDTSKNKGFTITLAIVAGLVLFILAITRLVGLHGKDTSPTPSQTSSASDPSYNVHLIPLSNVWVNVDTRAWAEGGQSFKYWAVDGDVEIRVTGTTNSITLYEKGPPPNTPKHQNLGITNLFELKAATGQKAVLAYRVVH